jgi:hypothetical protein
MDSSASISQADWQFALAHSQSKAAELFGRSDAEQKQLGYFHTLHEICQQPWTWLHTCDRMGLLIVSKAKCKLNYRYNS